MFEKGDILIAKENSASLLAGGLYQVESTSGDTTTVNGGVTCFNFIFHKLDLGAVLGKRVSVDTEMGVLKPSRNYEVIGLEITKEGAWLKVASEEGNYLVPLQAVKYLKGES